MSPADQVVDVARRADADTVRLSYLSHAERPAYIAGRAERAWQRLAWVVVGITIGACVCLLAGCGGGGPEDGPTPDQTIDPPSCAASGACT